LYLGKGTKAREHTCGVVDFAALRVRTSVRRDLMKA
jgi:hypothetical protein